MKQSERTMLVRSFFLWVSIERSRLLGMLYGAGTGSSGVGPASDGNDSGAGATSRGADVCFGAGGWALPMLASQPASIDSSLSADSTLLRWLVAEAESPLVAFQFSMTGVA